MQTHIIDISVVDGRPVDCNITRGEIIYFSQGRSASSLIRLLEELKFPLDNNDQILGFELSSLDGQQRTQIRRRLGLINQQPIIFKADQTIENNFKFYSDAAELNHAKSSVRFDSLRKRFELVRGAKVHELDVIQKFILEIVINLAKSPDILIIDNPLFFSDHEKYQDMMGYLYEEILNQGLTFMAIVPDASSVENYPGRFISL